MSLPELPPIDLGLVATEFGVAAPYGLNDFFGAGGAPGAAPISLNDFLGRSAFNGYDGSSQITFGQSLTFGNVTTATIARPSYENYVLGAGGTIVAMPNSTTGIQVSFVNETSTQGLNIHIPAGEFPLGSYTLSFLLTPSTTSGWVNNVVNVVGYQNAGQTGASTELASRTFRSGGDWNVTLTVPFTVTANRQHISILFEARTGSNQGTRNYRIRNLSIPA